MSVGWRRPARVGPLHLAPAALRPPALLPRPLLQAREAYERAVKLEPSDTQLQVSLQKALARESKQIAENKHIFKRRLDDGGGGGGGEQAKRPQTVRPSAAKKEKTLLSFADEDAAEDEG